MQIQHISASLKVLSTMLMDANNDMPLEQLRELGMSLAGMANDLSEENQKQQEQLEQSKRVGLSNT